MAGQLSNRGFQFLAKHEGCVKKPYYDGKFYSVGYGHNGPEVDPDREYSQAEAEAFFASDKVKFEKDVNKIWHEPMTQSMFDALFSLAYNTGNVSRSTIAQLVEGEGWRNVEKITTWWKKFKCTQNGKTLSGLVRRREDEAALFFSNDTNDGGPFVGNSGAVPADLWTPKFTGSSTLGASPYSGGSSSGGNFSGATGGVGSMYRNIHDTNNDYANRNSTISGLSLSTENFQSSVLKGVDDDGVKRTRIYKYNDPTILVDELSMPLDEPETLDASLNQKFMTGDNAPQDSEEENIES